MTYLDDQSRPVSVAAGLGGSTWGSFRRQPSGALRRVKSASLPMRSSREEAEADLVAYVGAKGWRRA